MKTKFKAAINAIIDKDDKTAKTLIQEAIQTDARYLAYREQLKNFGFEFATASIDPIIYEQIENILKDYPRPVKLKILDECWKQIKNGK